MILTQSVEARADIAGTQMALTKAVIERGKGRTIGKATVTGIVNDVDALGLGQEVDVYVKTSEISQLDADEVQVFGGKAHRATQDEEGKVKIEAYDTRTKMQEQLVKLEVGEPQYPWTVLVDLIGEVYGALSHTLENASKDAPYIAPKDEFNNLDTASPWRFGNAERGAPLIDAVEELLTTMGGNLWVDRNGVIRITPYPEHTVWKQPFITKLNSGEETRKAERVIFEGTGAISDLGQGAAYVNTQTSPTSAARIQADGEEPDAPEQTLKDDNVSTQEEADQKSFNTAVKQDQQRDMGSITVVGDPDIDLYDHIIVPDLQYDYGPTTVGNVPNNLQAGKFGVNSIKHTISASDGFLTKIDLGPPTEESLGATVLDSQTNIQQERLSQYQNSVEEEEISDIVGRP